MDASGRISSDKGNIHLEVWCYQGKLIAKKEIGRVTSQLATSTLDFSKINKGCPFIDFRLVGIPKATPTYNNIIISSLSLYRQE